jgi:hypothetical protein
MAGPVVDVVIPPANTNAVDWHFYFGTRGQFYLGVASVIHAIDEKFPALNIGYTFYDKQGRAVLGVMFFGPKVSNQGQLLSPGGIFVGTNLTPFLPAELRTSPNLAIKSNELMSNPLGSTEQVPGVLSLASKALRGEPLSINGRSVISDVQVQGRDMGKYGSKRKLKRLVDRYMEASRDAR